MTTEETSERQPPVGCADTVPNGGSSLEAVRAAVRAYQEPHVSSQEPRDLPGGSRHLPGRPPPVRRRARRSSDRGPSSPAGLPASALDTLGSLGLTVGSTIGRSRGPAAPRWAVDSQGRCVVVRVLRVPEDLAGATLLRRLAGLRTLRHRALVPVREVVTLPDHLVAVVVDFVEGASLDVVLGAQGRLNTGHLALLLEDLGSALAHLHERGAAHGDVSAGNVVVTTCGRPVLIDLVGSVMETGTRAYAAPERAAGGPATAASDVYALAAVLRQCAGSGYEGRRVGQVLADAFSQDPQARPSARDLAARAPELGAAQPVTLPDGARLAAGSLRAAVHAPTRVVGSRLRGGSRGRRSSRRGGRGAAGRRGRERPTTGPGHGSRRRRGGDESTVLASWRSARTVAACLLTAVLLAAVLVARQPDEGADGSRQVRAGSSAGAPTVLEPTGSEAPGPGTDPVPENSADTHDGAHAHDAAVPAKEQPGGAQAREAEDLGGPGSQSGSAETDNLVHVVVELAALRDKALMEGDAAALAATTVAGSPAAQADAQLLQALVDAGEKVTLMEISVSQIVEVDLPAGVAATWPGARAVTVRQSQGPSTRSGTDGERVVPAQAARQVLLVLVPHPWRVAEVRQP